MARNPAVDAYLADAQRWEQDLVSRAEASKRRAYWVAGGFGALAAMALLALVALQPLKSVQPYVIRVDNTTGVTDVVPVYAGKGEVAEVVTRYLLHNYVVTRERYFYAMAEQDYNLVGAYNSPVLNTAWMQAWDRGNPESPLVKYRDGTTVRSQVQSISFIKRADGTQDLAQVRFLDGIEVGGIRRGEYSALDCDDPVRIRRALQGRAVACPQSIGIADLGIPAGTGDLGGFAASYLAGSALGARSGEMKLGRWIGGTVLVLCVWASQYAFAEQTPKPGLVDSRVRVVAYDPDQVIKIRGYVGYQIYFRVCRRGDLRQFGRRRQ